MTESEGTKKVNGTPLTAHFPPPKLEYVKLPGTKGALMVKAVETAKKRLGRELYPFTLMFTISASTVSWLSFAGTTARRSNFLLEPTGLPSVCRGPSYCQTLLVHWSCNCKEMTW
jgi:hypothetical protein